MTNWQLVLTTISVIVGVGGFITALTVALANNRRANKAEQQKSDDEIKDYTSKQTEQTILLGQIGKDVADIKFGMTRFDEKLEKVSERLITHTNKIETMWKRIDEIKEFVGFGKGNYGK